MLATLLKFRNNTTKNAGDDLYGGQLDIILLNKISDTNSMGDGITHWKEISNLTDLNTISSQPTRICHCKNSKPNCNEWTQSIQIKQGEAFNFSFNCCS